MKNGAAIATLALVVGLTGCASTSDSTVRTAPAVHIAAVDSMAAAPDSVIVEPDVEPVETWTLVVPAGVDSSVAVHADSVRDLAYVSIDSEDSAEHLYQAALESFTGNQSAPLTGLDQAQEAVRLNPFHIAAWQLSAQYRLALKTDLQAAVAALDRALDLDQGQDVLYADRARIQLELGLPAKAGTDFRKAAAVARSLNEQLSAGVDSTVIFMYYVAAVDAEISALRVDSAITSLLGADLFSRTAEDSSMVTSRRDFLAWDDGNIAATSMRDSLRVLRESHPDSVVQGWSDLLGLLRTEAAKDEIRWELALDEYRTGDEVSAIRRMTDVVANAPQSSSRNPALDTLYAEYRETLGTMAAQTGLRILEQENDSERALAYYLHSFRTDWSRQAEVGLAIVDLLQQNPAAALQFAEKALESNPSPDVERDLRLRLVGLYRIRGQAELAREQKRLLDSQMEEDESDA